MKISGLIAFAAALLPLSFAASAQYRTGGYDALYDSETVSMLKEHVSYLASAQLEGRKAGSEGEKMAATYVYDALSSYGVEMLSPRTGAEFGLLSESGDTLVSRNVVGFIPGYDQQMKDHFIVVGARLDNLGMSSLTIDGERVNRIACGANGNASGLAMMIELARMVQTNSLLFRKSVVFVAFGASCESFAGSWYFADRDFKDNMDVMVNLDMLGLGSNGFYAFTCSNQDLNALVASMKNDLQPVLPEIVAAEPYPSDHRSFYAKEIPSVFFTTGRYHEHNTSNDTPSILEYEEMERELEYIFNFVTKLASSQDAIQFHPGQAQRKGPSYEDVIPYYDCDQRPMFLNSPNPGQFLSKWVYQYLKYPPQAVKDGIQGTVQVSFIIDKTGKVTDVTVSRGVDPLLDEEAVRVVSASPKWRPARHRGEKVRSAMTIGVEFRLRHKSEKSRFGINDYAIPTKQR